MRVEFSGTWTDIMSMDSKKIIERALAKSEALVMFNAKLPVGLVERFKKICKDNGAKSYTAVLQALIQDFVESAEKLKK